MSQALPDKIDELYLERRNLLDAIVQSEAGISLLQWIVRITGFNKPIMSLEDAARRDVWLTIRRYVDVDKLGQIEHQEIRELQEQERQLMELVAKDVLIDELYPGGSEDE